MRKIKLYTDAQRGVVPPWNIKICEFCNQSYERPRYRQASLWAKQRFCSKTCSGMARGSNVSKLKDRKEMYSLYLKGETLMDIARKFDVSYQRVHQIVSKLGENEGVDTRGAALRHLRGGIRVADSYNHNKVATPIIRKGGVVMDEATQRLFYVDIVRSWDSEDAGVIAKRWGKSKASINMIAGWLRKKGIPLTIKTKPKMKLLTSEFLEELQRVYEEGSRSV